MNDAVSDAGISIPGTVLQPRTVVALPSEISSPSAEVIEDGCTSRIFVSSGKHLGNTGISLERSRGILMSMQNMYLHLTCLRGMSDVYVRTIWNVDIRLRCQPETPVWDTVSICE